MEQEISLACPSIQCHEGARCITPAIISLLVGWLPLFSFLHALTVVLLLLLVRGGRSNALLVISQLRDRLPGRWLNRRSVVVWDTALTTISALE